MNLHPTMNFKPFNDMQDNVPLTLHLADACRKNITNELIHVESDSVESKIADITV